MGWPHTPTSQINDRYRAKAVKLVAIILTVNFEIGSSEVYGNPECHPQREDYWGHVNPIGLRSCYDEGKRYAETVCGGSRSSTIEDSIILSIKVARIFNTYGPRMHPNDGRVVSKESADYYFWRGPPNAFLLLCR